MKKNYFFKTTRLFAAGIFSLACLNIQAQVTTFSYSGAITTYTVPAGVTSIQIDVYGAQGGNGLGGVVGGNGARMRGDFVVVPGQILKILVGGQGISGTNNGEQAGGSGGGGSFVTDNSNNPLIIAGGGGGAMGRSGLLVNGGPGQITQSGQAGNTNGGFGGTGGSGGGTWPWPGWHSGTGGGGLLTNGSAPSNGNTGSFGTINGPGIAFINGGNGGIGGSMGRSGGFGGGGAAGFTGGGGGGYSGGGSGTHDAPANPNGGGGGSYNSGTNQLNTIGFQNGNGSIVITNLFSSSITQTVQILCNGQSTASITATPTGGTGPYTYSWAPSGGTSATASGLAAGTYTVTITDAALSTTTSTFTVTQPSVLTATTMQSNVSCNGGTNGSAMVMATGGTAPYTYSWSPSGGTAATASGLVAGSYTCAITDANGCSTTLSVTITQPTPVIPSSSATSIACNGGTADVTVVGSGGTSPYTGTGTFTVVAGSYNYSVTDANGCIGITSITVSEPSVLVASSSATSIACFGGNADITVTGSGGTSPYSGEGTFTVVAGTYNYTVTDANGCTNTTSITVTEPTAIATSVTQINVTCFGGADGSVDMTVTGGTAPYNFNWNSGTYFTEDISGLTAGTYAGVLTDANGCTDGGSVVITEPTAIVTVVSSTIDPSTCGGTDGMIDISVTGGTPGYTYLWSNNATTEDISGIGAGTYSLFITDASGCTTTIAVQLNDPNPPAVTLTLGTTVVCADDASVTLSGGSPVGGVYSGTAVAAGIFDPSSTLLGANTITYSYTDSITGCSASTTDVIVVNACTGITSSSVSETNFVLMPNPNNGTFMLQLNTTETAVVLIYDALGQLVSSRKIQPDVQEQMNIMNSGVYIVTVITSDGQRTTQRVVVSN